MDRLDDTAVAMLDRLPASGNGDRALRSYTRIERRQRCPAEQNHEEQYRNDEPGTDFALRVASFKIERRGEQNGIGHAAFSEVFGPANRATTSCAGPNILGRPSSRTSSASAASRT